MSCVLVNIQNILGKKWNLLILQELYHKNRSSFNQLSNELKKPTNTVLSNKLKQLEENDLIKKIIIKNKPLSTEYSLTQKGNELMQLFDITKKWGVKYQLVPKNCVKNNCNDCFSIECKF